MSPSYASDSGKTGLVKEFFTAFFQHIVIGDLTGFVLQCFIFCMGIEEETCFQSNGKFETLIALARVSGVAKLDRSLQVGSYQCCLFEMVGIRLVGKMKLGRWLLD